MTEMHSSAVLDAVSVKLETDADKAYAGIVRIIGLENESVVPSGLENELRTTGEPMLEAMHGDPELADYIINMLRPYVEPAQGPDFKPTPREYGAVHKIIRQVIDNYEQSDDYKRSKEKKN